MDMVELPLHLIDEDTDQPRYQFDEDSLQELVSSIAELGLLSPIKVRTIAGGRYKIIYGNRRYKACKLLGKTAIPCIVSTVTDELEIYLEQIAENLTRSGFSPIEEAEAFDKLLHNSKFNSSTKFLASKLGKPESYIKNKCELLKFGPSVKKLVVAGSEIKKDQLTEDQLLPLKDLPLEFRDPLAKIVARDELPVSDVKKIARLFKEKTLSDNTKNKLLFKTGPELIDTWSVYMQNSAARAKSAEAKAAKAAAEEAAPAEGQAVAVQTPAAAGAGTSQGTAAQATGAETSQGAAAQAAGAGTSQGAAAQAAGANGQAETPLVMSADQAALAAGQAALAAATPAGSHAATSGFAAAADSAIEPPAGMTLSPARESRLGTAAPSSLESRLQHLLASLNEQTVTFAAGEVSAASAALDAIGDKAAFRSEVDELIDQLEAHLVEWKRLRSAIDAS